ncbi:hypothetical protein Tco_0281120 [Tanacetum coccineum]
MEKGFLNSGKKNDVVRKDDSLLHDLASKIKKIDGKLLGKDGKPLKAYRRDQVSSLTTTDVQSDVSEAGTNAATPVLHNPKGEPLKSILKNNNKVTFMEECNKEGSFAFAAVGVVKGLNGMADVQGISDKSSTNGVCNSKAKKVNLYSLVHENVIPGANITLHKESVDEIVNKFTDTLYGHFIGCKHAFPIVDRYICVLIRGGGALMRALIEVDAEKALADSIVVAVPINGEKGHSLETISIEYEWKPPRCSIRITKPKTTLVYKDVTKPSPPKEKSSEESHVNDTEKPTTSKLIHDELDLMELKNSFDKLKEEGTTLELVEASVHEKSNNVSTHSNNDNDKKHGKEVTKEAEASFSKPKLSFGPLDLSNFSDSDEDEVFASQEEHDAYLASIGGGHQMEQEDFDLYDDDYADQIQDLPGQIQAFRDFQLHSGMM